MKILSIITAAALLIFTGCTKTQQAKTKAPSIAVFIPGIMADSPTYAHVAEGVQQAVDTYNESIEDEKKKAQLYIMEAGTNQSEWSTKLTALTAEGKYDLIISSNPSLPEIAEPIAKQFPKQKYIFLDAMLENNPSIYTVSYNQRDQAYLSGYIAGLYSKSHKVGLVAAQEYPIMNTILYPYYAKGAADAYNGTTCEFRIVGNWYDGSKGAEITDALAAAGIDVVLPICGGASQGVISSAREHGINIVWFDENGFKKAPGVIISCCMTKQAFAANEAVTQYLAGNTAWGTSKSVGMKDGYAEYFNSDPAYIQAVPEDIRNKMDALIASIKDGSFELPQTLN